MNWIINLYRTNARFRAFAQAIEGGVILGFISATTNGFDWSKKGWTALGSAMGGGLIVAVRNYFLNRINQPETVQGQKINPEAPKSDVPLASGPEKPKQ